MEEEVGENRKNKFTKEKSANCDNGREGTLARLLEFLRHREIQLPAIARFIHDGLVPINLDYISGHIYKHGFWFSLPSLTIYL